MKRKSFAKINLFLRVVGKKNGYHELESLMARIDLFDEIEVLPSDSFAMEIDGEFGAAVDVDDNLLTRILDYFVENFGVFRDLSVKLTKNIPVGAGLGGGSGNGAVFMGILNEIFNLGLKKEELMAISMNFGSDIAFFFEEAPAIIKGRGEIVERFVNFTPFEVLLVNPRVALSTKEVFACFDGDFSPAVGDFSEKNADELMAELGNDLEEAAVEACPEVAEVLARLGKLDLKGVRMSGAGASCFGAIEGEVDFSGLDKGWFVRRVRVF